MSTPTSDRAAGGVSDLQSEILDWLRDHDPLTQRLEWIESVEDGTDVIRPPNHLRRARSADGDNPDIVLTAEVWSPNTIRENAQTRRAHSGQVVLSLRERAADKLPGQWETEVRAEIVACLTTLREGWYAPDVSGGSTGLEWNDQVNREELAITYGLTHRQW